MSLPLSAVAPFIGKGAGLSPIPAGRYLFAVSELTGPSSLWIINTSDPRSEAFPYGKRGDLPNGINEPEAIVSIVNSLYVIDTGQIESLWRINPHNPSDTTPPYGKVGNLPSGINGSPDGAAFDRRDLYIAHNNSNTDRAELWRIDETNPPSTSGRYGKVGDMPSGIDSVNAMAYYDNSLYVVSRNDHLWKINKSSPSSTSGSYGDKGDMDTELGLFRPYALTEHNGGLYMLDYFVLHTVNASNAVATAVGELVNNVNLPGDLRVSGATSHLIS